MNPLSSSLAHERVGAGFPRKEQKRRIAGELSREESSWSRLGKGETPRNKSKREFAGEMEAIGQRDKTVAGVILVGVKH